MPDDKLLIVASRHPLAWSPRGLTKPEVDPALTELHPVVRAAEVLRYSIAKLEYWISPEGHLREATRLTAFATALLAVPGLMLAPIVTLCLVQVSGWLDLIIKILLNLAGIVIGLALAKVLIKELGKERH